MLKKLLFSDAGEAARREEQMLSRLSTSAPQGAGPDESTLKRLFTSPTRESSHQTEDAEQNGRRSSDELVRAVIRKNPDFLRLDGILTSLAEACLNPVTGETVQVIGVCSAEKGEGKTTIALGLATALARRVASEILLLEGDITSPTMAIDLHRETEQGLTECLAVEESLEQAIQSTPVGHLSVMTAGRAAGEPFSILKGSSLRTLLHVLRRRFRYIILDMPAILEREETGRLVELVDGVILVVEAGRSSKEVTEAGIAAIGPDKLIGAVLNRAQTSAPRWISKILSTEEPGQRG